MAVRSPPENRRGAGGNEDGDKLKEKSLRTAETHGPARAARRPDRVDAPLVSLQHAAGNRAVTQLVRSPSSSSWSPVQRMGLMSVKNELYDTNKSLVKDEKYWPLYNKWGRVVGYEAMVKILEPLENMEAVRRMLDEFSQTKEASLDEEGFKKLEFLRDYGKSTVFTALIAGIDPSDAPAAKLGKLHANFVRLGPSVFEYTMAQSAPSKFFGGQREGDCNTVVNTFIAIAEKYFGIGGIAKKSSYQAGFNTRFTAPKATTIDGKTGNVDGGAFWLFDDHWWVDGPGGVYDVLFGRLVVETSGWVRERHDDDVFGDRKIEFTGNKVPISGRYLSKPV